MVVGGEGGGEGGGGVERLFYWGEGGECLISLLFLFCSSVGSTPSNIDDVMKIKYLL